MRAAAVPAFADAPASWRPIHQSSRAIKVGGSPFETLAEAEEACKAMLEHLTVP